MLTLRRARPDDAEALSDLSQRAKASNGYDAAFMAACVAELTVTRADIERDAWWLAEDGGLGGCVCLATTDAPEIGEIHAFYVDPARQRQGIGRQLWAVALAEAQARGLRRLVLDADPFAVPFYEALGLRVVGMVPSGSIPGRELPRMALKME